MRRSAYSFFFFNVNKGNQIKLQSSGSLVLPLQTCLVFHTLALAAAASSCRDNAQDTRCQLCSSPPVCDSARARMWRRGQRGPETYCEDRSPWSGLMPPSACLLDTPAHWRLSSRRDGQKEATLQCPDSLRGFSARGSVVSSPGADECGCYSVLRQEMGQRGKQKHKKGEALNTRKAGTLTYIPFFTSLPEV